MISYVYQSRTRGSLVATQVTVEQAEILGDDNNDDMHMLEDVRAELVAAGYMRPSAAQALVDAKRSGGGKKGKGNNSKGNGKQVRGPSSCRLGRGEKREGVLAGVSYVRALTTHARVACHGLPRSSLPHHLQRPHTHGSGHMHDNEQLRWYPLVFTPTRAFGIYDMRCWVCVCRAGSSSRASEGRRRGRRRR